MRLTNEQLLLRQKYNAIMGILVNTLYATDRIRFEKLRKILCGSVFNGKYPECELNNHLSVLEERKLIRRKKDKTPKKPYYVSTPMGEFVYIRTEAYSVFDKVMKELDKYYKGEIIEKHLNDIREVMYAMTQIYNYLINKK